MDLSAEPTFNPSTQVRSAKVRHRLQGDANVINAEEVTFSANQLERAGTHEHMLTVEVGPFVDERRRCFQMEAITASDVTFVGEWRCTEPRIGWNNVHAFESDPSKPWVLAHRLNGSSPSTVWTLKTGYRPQHQFIFDASHWNGDDVADFVGFEQHGVSANGQRSTKLHVQNGVLGDGAFLFNKATALHQTDESWSLHLADWNSDGTQDLVGVKRQGASSTEIHVIDGRNPNRFLSHQATALHRTDGQWDFDIADWNSDGQPDLVGIKRLGRRSTELHVIDGRNPGRFLAQQETVLHRTTASSWDFEVADWNADGHPDLVGFKRQGASSTEIHVVDGANPQRFVTQTSTGLPRTSENWSFVVTN